MNDRITLRFLASPQDSAVGGTTVAAGRVLEWIDKAGYACAVGWSGSYCVTAYVGNVHFTAPIRAGELVEAHASIIHTGRTSMQVLVVIEAADAQSRSFTPAMHCILVFVAVDDDGTPREVPGWTPVHGCRPAPERTGRAAPRRPTRHPRRHGRAAVLRRGHDAAHRVPLPRRAERRELGRERPRRDRHGAGSTRPHTRAPRAGRRPTPGRCTRAASTSSGPSASGTSWRSTRGSSTPGRGACTSPSACGRGRRARPTRSSRPRSA